MRGRGVGAVTELQLSLALSACADQVAETDILCLLSPSPHLCRLKRRSKDSACLEHKSTSFSIEVTGLSLGQVFACRRGKCSRVSLLKSPVQRDFVRVYIWENFINWTGSPVAWIKGEVAT